MKNPILLAVILLATLYSKVIRETPPGTLEKGRKGSLAQLIIPGP